MHRFHYIDDELYCEEVPLRRICDEVGTPVYVYSRATLERHFRVFSEPFSEVNHLVCYSMKACSNLAILRLFANMGGGVDIVSGGELYRAIQAGIDPAPERSTTTWATFLRSQAEALLAADFIETVTLTGTRMYILAVSEHASRRVRVLGATAHPTAAWVTQAARNLVMDLEDTGCRVKFLVRDRDAKYPPLFDAILADAGIAIVLSGVRIPRMNSIMERWVLTCRRELLDRTLIWNQRHLLQALREYELFYNAHRPHQGITNARPLQPLPQPITDPDRLARLDIRRRDRLGGILHEYHHAA